jgi:hypothetical protein
VNQVPKLQTLSGAKIQRSPTPTTKKSYPLSNPNCYHSDTTTAAYSLRWSWTGWPSIGSMPSLTENDWRELADAWEKDGIRLLERNCLSDYWQVIGICFIWSWSSKVGVGSATSSFWGNCLKSAKRSRWNVIIS